MKKRSGRIVLLIAVLCALVGILLFFPRQPEISGVRCSHETEFGGVYIERTIDEFNSLGFAYGDSVDVSFSNGCKLEDLPYYNGYYAANGEPLLVAYPGYDYIKAALCNGDDLWIRAGLDENSTAKIKLHEQGKYLEIQNARNLHYEDDRALYDSDIEFANFRSVKAGKIRPDLLYRSASPCDNRHNRAPYVNQLMKEAGVQLIVDLADSDEMILERAEKPDFALPVFKEMYEQGKVIALNLDMNYSSADFQAKVCRGLTAVSEKEGPYLVHCTEGKDRTGFVCMLIEAFSGASYEEIEQDYMSTYKNYYGIDRDNEKYDLIVENLLVPMIESIVGDEAVDIRTADLSVYARNYLLSGGMTEEQLDALMEKLS